MKILVTGAAGFIGSHVCEHFARQGHEVVGIDCFTPYYDLTLKRLNAEDIQKAGVTLHELDLAGSVEDVVTAVQDTNVIFHLAAQPGISATTQFDTYLRNNVIASQNLITAAKQWSGLQLFVNIATSSVYGYHATSSEEAVPQPTSYYGVTKLTAEQLALAENREGRLPACSLRIFSVYGPRERPEKLYPKLIATILKDEPFPLFEGSLDHSRSYTYIGDILKGFQAVVDNPDKVLGEIINIGTDEERKTREGIEIVQELLGKKAQFAMQPKRPGDQLRTRANIAKARRLLNYEPSTSLQDGLKDVVDWFQTNADRLVL